MRVILQAGLPADNIHKELQQLVCHAGFEVVSHTAGCEPEC